MYQRVECQLRGGGSRLTVQRPAPRAQPVHRVQLDQGAGRTDSVKDTNTGSSSTIFSLLDLLLIFPFEVSHSLLVSLSLFCSPLDSVNISSFSHSLLPVPSSSSSSSCLLCRDSKKLGKKLPCPIYLSNPSNPLPFLSNYCPHLFFRSPTPQPPILG